MGHYREPISQKKLNADFERFDVLNVDYVKKAKQFALDYIETGESDLELLKEIRLAATADRNHLKGDFVISMFLDLIQSKEFQRWEHGKMIHTNNAEVEKIYRNHFSKELSVTEFCRRNPITRNKYYRILNCDVKHNETKAQLLEIKMKIEKEYTNK